jgi:predicted dehydrogenase
MKLGFIGFGLHARENLLPASRSIFSMEVAAICDRDPTVRKEAGMLFGADRIYADHCEMMDNCALDGVIAACYPADHYRIAVDAIDRGIPVFIEKPLAPSSRQVDELIERAAKRNVVTGVGMNFRYAEVTRRLAELASGHFNTISLRQLANKPFGKLWDYDSALKSFLHAQTIHGLDMLVHLCGSVRDLHVVHNNCGNRIVFTVILEFESGAHGSLITSNTSPHFVFDFDVICRDKFYVTGRSLWDMTISETGKRYAGGERKKWRDSWTPSPLASGFARSGYLGELEDFVAAVRAGSKDSGTAFSTLRETYRCLDLIESACSSNEFLSLTLAS